MSKSIRIADYLAEEVERLAASEKRSLANMVQVLLEQALQLPEHFNRPKIGPATQEPREEITVADGKPRDFPARTVKPRAHPSEPFSLVCPNRASHEPGVFCSECKGDGGRR